MSPEAVRNMMAAADSAIARLVAAEELRTTLEEIKRLHAPAQVCRGCCSARCPGDCDWSDEYDGELMRVCAVCCIDMNADRLNDECLDWHEHGREHGDKPACATSEIIARRLRDEADVLERGL